MGTRKSRVGAILGLAAALTLSPFSQSHSAAANWSPTGTVEVVVPGGAGGGIDNTARNVQKLLETTGLIESPFSIVNKPGGSASIGLTYLSKLPPDGMHIAFGAATLLTNEIVGRSTLKYTDITVLPQLFSEGVAVAVRPGSSIKTARDLLARLKEDPSSVTIAVPSLTSTNHITAALIAKAAGANPRKLSLVVFNSSSKGITAVLGGHVDAVVAPAGNMTPYLGGKTLNVLAVTSPERLSGAFAKVPTWREFGIDVATGVYRHVIGPGGMPDDRIAYWDELFARLVSTEAWRNYLERNSYQSNFMKSKESTRFLAAQHKQLREILEELGFAK